MTTRDGLTTAEAARRLNSDGPNALPSEQRRTFLRFVADAAHEPMFLLLLGGGVLYLILGEAREGAFLFLMILLTLGLTLYQEGKSERALDALRDLSSPQALVIRDGQPTSIDSRNIVCDDLFILAEGSRVPADGTLVSGNDLQVDESLLTGESVAVTKTPFQSNALLPDRPGGDDTPMLYAGSLVVRGHGIVRVTATGARSEIGRIGIALQNVRPEPSPLQKQTARMVTGFAIAGLAASVFLIAFYGLLKGNWLEALLAGIALAMSMLPEEFPVVLTVFPALGAWRMARHQVLTRRLAAIETLGAVSVLCVDKTGTLTENRMSVAGLAVDGELFRVDETSQASVPDACHALIEFSILASDIAPSDPMERAIHRAGRLYLTATEQLHDDWTLVREYAISSELRAMSNVWKAIGRDEHVVAAKGAPEAIIDLCHVDSARRQSISETADEMARQGLRVLGVARAQFSGPAWPDSEHDFDFEFLGLIGLADPLRHGIDDAVRQFHQAGIRVVMITGDYPATASAIAQHAGIEPGEILTGDALAAMSDAELSSRIRNAGVCARIAPGQKLRIVQALKANGDIVAMTGDGVNDAPALKAAHVGIAMGKRGTDVAREAASLVLLDDRFTSIVQAIKVGRLIFNNMQKSMVYILSMHVPIAGLALLPVLLGWPILLYPMHIVFLELIIDPSCSLAFENEPAEPGIMNAPPRDPAKPIFGRSTILFAALEGAGALLVVMAAYWWAHQALPEDESRAFAFVSLITANLSLIFSNRSRTRSVLATLRAPNRILWLVTTIALALLALTIYLPYLASIFRFAPLPITELVAAFAIGLSCALWVELLKRLQQYASARPAKTEA